MASPVSLDKAINPLPDKSPNLETNVSIKTVDLYLSFFWKVLKIVSLVGLLTPYSKTLNKTVTTPTDTIEGANPYNMYAKQNINPYESIIFLMPNFSLSI